MLHVGVRGFSKTKRPICFWFWVHNWLPLVARQARPSPPLRIQCQCPQNSAHYFSHYFPFPLSTLWWFERWASFSKSWTCACAWLLWADSCLADRRPCCRVSVRGSTLYERCSMNLVLLWWDVANQHVHDTFPCFCFIKFGELITERKGARNWNGYNVGPEEHGECRGYRTGGETKKVSLFGPKRLSWVFRPKERKKESGTEVEQGHWKGEDSRDWRVRSKGQVWYFQKNGLVWYKEPHHHITPHSCMDAEFIGDLKTKDNTCQRITFGSKSSMSRGSAHPATQPHTQQHKRADTQKHTWIRRHIET